MLAQIRVMQADVKPVGSSGSRAMLQLAAAAAALLLAVALLGL